MKNSNIKIKLYVWLAFFASVLLSSNSVAELQKIGVVGAANQILAAMDESKVSRILALGNDVFFNDTISTDGSGNAQVMFLDKSALTIGPNASVVIDKFVYNPVDGGGELAMRGTRGAFRFIGGALSKKQEVKFKTPVGTIGIRGGIAIVEINPTSGATNATFLYGEKMTFQNLAGQKQETTNSGFAIGVATPTSPPTQPVAVKAEVLAAKIQQNFVSNTGQNGGTTNVPTSKDMEKSGSNVTGESKPSDVKNPPAGQGGGNVNKQDGTGKASSSTNGQSNENNGNAPDRQSQNGNADNGQTTKQNANNINASTTTATNANMQLTADGGYNDANGNHHSAADLAAMRLADANASNGINNNAAVPADNGGYVAAGGTAASGGGYYTTAGVYTPATAAIGDKTTYAAPITNTTGNYVAAGGTAAPVGGYYTPAGVYTPATTSATGGYYGAPAAAANNYYASNTYVAPVATYNTPSYNTSPANNFYSFNTAVATTTYNTTGTNYINPVASYYYTSAGTYTAAYVAANYVATTTYTYVPTNVTTYTYVSATTFDTMQQNENIRLNTTNLGAASFSGSTTFVTNDESLPSTTTGTVAGTSAITSTSLINAETLQARNDYKTAMNSGSCSSCDYVKWDAWAKIIPDNYTTSSTQTSTQGKLVPYIYGVETSLGNIPQNLSATYTGNASYNYSGNSAIQTGTFTATITSDSGRLATLSSISFSGVPGAGTLSSTTSKAFDTGGSATFSNIGISNTSTSYSGTVNGSLFGPAAENIGGKLTYSGAGTTGAGVFLGKK